MKIIIKVIIMLLLIVGMVNSQEFIKVEKQDWEFLKQTTLEMDSSLTQCKKLNGAFARRIDLFDKEVESLKNASYVADSLMIQKDKQLRLRRKQVSLLNNEIRKNKLKVWLYRGGGVAAIILTVLIIR